MRPHSGRPCIPDVTLCQLWPPSCVTWTNPSSVPTQMVLGSTGEMEMERIASKVSAPLRSRNTGPPLETCLLLSLCVRSGLTGVQFAPPSVERNRTLPPRYTSFGSVGETAMGEVQLKRYLRSEGFFIDTPSRYGRMKLERPFSRLTRWIKPFCESA